MDDSDKRPSGVIASVLHSEGIQALSSVTGLDNSAVAGVLLVLALGLVFGFGCDLACSVVGFVYPMYKSFQAIEQTGLGVVRSEKEATEEDLERCVHLLMYWVAYTFFTLSEYFSDILLFWVPFYHPIKLCGLIWCLKYDGAQRLYVSTFGKVLKTYEPQIEESLNRGTSYAQSLRDDVRESGRGMVKQHSAQLVAGAGNVFAKVSTSLAANDTAGAKVD